MMWSPIIVTPPVVIAGIGGRVQQAVGQDRAAGHRDRSTRSTGCRASTTTRAGWPASPAACSLASYNVPMGPPIMAPGLMTIVGGMGLLAALLRREGVKPCPTCAEPDHLPNLRAGGSHRVRRGCRGSGAGPRPQMIGRYPDYDVLDVRSRLGRGHAQGGSRTPGRLGPTCASSSRARRRRCARSATSCSPRTRSRGCRWSRWSTTSWPPAGSTATSTRTCPTTATRGAWCSRP